MCELLCARMLARSSSLHCGWCGMVMSSSVMLAASRRLSRRAECGRETAAMAPNCVDGVSCLVANGRMADEDDLRPKSNWQEADLEGPADSLLSQDRVQGQKCEGHWSEGKTSKLHRGKYKEATVAAAEAP